jgi:hypothetical protein
MKNKKQIFSLSVIILINNFLVNNISFAQIQLNLNNPTAGNLNPTSCWNATIINLSSQNLTVYLSGSIKNLDNVEIVSLRSQPFFLRPGTNRIMQDQVLTAQINYKQESVKKTVMSTGNLPSGEYELCTSIFLSREVMEEAADCQLISYQNTNKNERNGSGAEKWTRYIDLYGHATVENFNSSRQGTDQIIPANYTRFDLQASAAVMNVPFTLSAFYTTEQNNLYPDINAITFSFDSDHFKETLQNMVTQQAIALAEQQSGELLNKLSKIDELNKLSRIVNDGALQEELGQLQGLENKFNELTQQVNSGDLEEVARNQKIKELEQLKNKLASLRAKKAQFDNINQRVQTLLKFKEELEANGGLDALDQMDMSKLQDPAFLKGELQKLGLFSGSNKFFFGIRNLAIGTAFPFYTPTTLNGIKVDGGLIEFNPGLFYLNFVAGKTKSAIYIPGSNELMDFSNTMVAGKIGIGSPGDNHFHLTGIGFQDNKSDYIEDTPPFSLRPKSNYVFGTDFAIVALKKNVRLNGEFAVSSYNKDLLEDPVILDSASYDLLPDFMKPNTSTGVDMTYDVGLFLNLFDGNTRIKLDTRYVGPGYFSFGSPNLRTDLQRIGIRLDQYLAKRKLQITAHYRADKDNLFEAKGSVTNNTLAGAGINFRIKQLPFIRLSYDINKQDNEFRKYDITNFNLLSGHFYKTGKWNASTNLNLNYVQNSNDSIIGHYTANFFSLGQTFTSPTMVSFTINLNHSKVQTNEITSIIRGADISTGFRIARIINFNIGGTYFTESNDKSRFGGHGMLTLPLFNFLHLSVDARYNSYENVIDPLVAFEEFYVRTILTATW